MKRRKTKSLELEPVTIHHQVAVGGRVVDAASKRPIPGARVRITGKGALPTQEFTTTNSGYYYFIDLPDGAYELHAWHGAGGTRRGQARNRAKVARDPEGNLPSLFLDLPLVQTTVSGSVTATGKRPVMMAQVRIQGSGEQAFTNADGQYWLRGVEKGNRTLRVTAQGFKQSDHPVRVIEVGGECTVDIRLERANPTPQAQ